MINFIKEKLRLIIFSILGIGTVFAMNNLGADVFVSEIPAQTIIGYNAFNIFENEITGERITEPTTLQEHEAVRGKNAKFPQKDGYKWIQNGLTPIYITPGLTNNTYYKTRETDISSTTKIKIKVENKEGIILITDIVNEKLTPEGLQKLQ